MQPVARLPIRRGLTAYLFLGVATMFLAAILAWSTGWIGYAAYFPMAVISLYLLAIGCHDSVHGAAHDRPSINLAVGWICTFAMGGPWWLFRRAHLLHHARTDQPEDPELYVHGPLWQLPFRFMTGNISYYRLFPSLPTREKAACVAVVSFIVGMFVAAPAAVGWGWILPMQCAAGLFAFNTVFLPHGRYRELVMSRFPVITGFHDDHHARPAYPVHQYPALHAWRAARVLPKPVLAKAA